jgi:hypothetical protein
VISAYFIIGGVFDVGAMNWARPKGLGEWIGCALIVPFWPLLLSMALKLPPAPKRYKRR